jgi:DNA-binding transcriptional LysR family regulator
MSLGPPRRGRSAVPLDLLPGFEAAARLLSFSRAAEELSLTQSAISRQIKALEEEIGTDLFVRGHRSLALTQAGQELQIAATEVLARMREVILRLQPGTERFRVTVTTVPGFASLWLIPRLANFAVLAPQVDVRIAVSHQLVDLERDQIDLAVRYCSPKSAVGPILFEEQFQPVCAPELCRDPDHPLREISDLCRHPFLEQAEDTGPQALLDWKLWLRSVGHPDLAPLRTISFSQYDSVIAAALAGQGVAMGRLPLINGYLREGRLVAPFSDLYSSTKAYCLVRSRYGAQNAAAEEFCTWLIAETGKEALETSKEH